MKPHTTKKAFTLIEVLLVIALIAILAAITFIAINPARNFASARDTDRQSGVTQILNAISQYLGDGNTVASLSIPTCTLGAEDIGTGVGNVDLSSLAPTYIVDIPEDPTAGSGDGADTGYTICTDTGDRITVAAPSCEVSGCSISVSR